MTRARPLLPLSSCRCPRQGSFGRVLVHATKTWTMEAWIDYVPAPAGWDLQEDDAPKLAHLNFNVARIQLTAAAHGTHLNDMQPKVAVAQQCRWG